MTILNNKTTDQENVNQVSEPPVTKWRRSGTDRRSSSDAHSGEERRAIKGRRTGWLEILSAIIFPRGSK